jgi:RNA polymerase sigma-70 factor (ECF subfamily)
VAGLVANAREGDRRAFGELHRLFSKMVHGVLIAHVSADDAKDLVQDVFLTAMQKLESLRDDAAFGGWLQQIARTRAYAQLRGRKPTEQLDESLVAPERPTADAARILKALRGLPEAYRETLAMRLIEGMTGPEISERTGLTEGSVRVNLHRGMKQLKEALGMAPGGEGDGG